MCTIKLYALPKLSLINAKTVFISTLIVVPTVALLVYFTGLNAHRSLYLNSLISTSILVAVFFVFITTGLYNGWKLKDGLGNFLKKFRLWKKPESFSMGSSGLDFSGLELDVEGCFFTVLAWIVVAFLGAFLLFWIGAFLWGTILVTGGILYWIIFRAFRLIFRNSIRCKGDLQRSAGIALLYTFLYNCWIYGIILGTHFLMADG